MMAGKAVLPDTDVLVDFLRGDGKAVSLVTRSADRMILSAVVVAELYAGVKGERERAVIDDFVSLFEVVPVTGELARTAGLFRSEYGSSHGVGLADAMIAATVVSEGAELKTLNTRHYPMLEGLEAAYAK